MQDKEQRREVDVKENMYFFKTKLSKIFFVVVVEWNRTRICKERMSKVTSVYIHSGMSSNKTAA